MKTLQTCLDQELTANGESRNNIEECYFPHGYTLDYLNRPHVISENTNVDFKGFTIKTKKYLYFPIVYNGYIKIKSVSIDPVHRALNLVTFE